MLATLLSYATSIAEVLVVGGAGSFVAFLIHYSDTHPDEREEDY